VTLIDNVFIKSSRDCNLKPYVNGLSDHDAQLVVIKNGTVTKEKCKSIDIRDINKDTILEFQTVLSWESWEDIFAQDNVNSMLNNFHNTHLRCFYASFPKKRKRFKSIQGKWITNGIRISCKKKRELILLCNHN
jgi:hypothetical protein